MEQLEFSFCEPLKSLDELGVKSDYESLINHCSRLVSFAQSSQKNLHYAIEQKQKEMAVEDLIVFSLRARRFISSTSIVLLSRNIFIPALSNKSDSNFLCIWEIVSTIIHSNDIAIFRSKHELVQMYNIFSKRKYVYEDFLRNPESESISPLVFIESDHKLISFNLEMFLFAFVERVLAPAIVSCRDRGLELTYLEWFERNLEKILN